VTLNGVGLNDTRLYNVDLPGFQIDRHSVGDTLQAGVDIPVTRNGHINLDVKRIWIDTQVRPGRAARLAASRRASAG